MQIDCIFVPPVCVPRRIYFFFSNIWFGSSGYSLVTISVLVNIAALRHHGLFVQSERQFQLKTTKQKTKPCSDNACSCFCTIYCLIIENYWGLWWTAAPHLVQSECSAWEALSAQVFGNGVQAEHGLVDLIDGVLGVNRRQLLGREHLLRGLDHALCVVITQLHAGADDGAAKPLVQDLQGGQAGHNQWDQGTDRGTMVGLSY